MNSTPGSRRRRIRSVVASIATIVMLTGSLGACVSRDESNQKVSSGTVDLAEIKDLTLKVGDQRGGTESLLTAAGQLTDLPFKIEFSTFTSGPPQVEAATAGKIDFAVTGNTPPIFGAASNAKVRFVSAYTNPASGDVIVARGANAPASVADLRGKKVAVAKGSSAHGNLLRQLEKAGLKLGQDVEPVFLQPADAQSAFVNGSVDAWAIWDPYTALIQLDPTVKTIATGEGVVNGFGFGIASNEALADARRNTALRELVVRIAKASQWAKQNPVEWAARYGEAIKIDPRAARAAQDRSLRPAIEITDAVVASEQELADAFDAAGQLQGKVTIADFFDDRFNEAVKPYAITPEK
ncbi:ABC transporter substrate-binding protein [Tsukamurella asaccharolytica]|uniref:Putative aliphatic sulfonates-binding protein n=1 Tax=Tsukamurella asaccharolytica TaxID=2592067 RepID=A0A5C5R6E8_9ACTN|nr:ABC transporter substrate-binding protein [Tsukamurella asaccharolytica]TWS18787.1 ABC transporter substrate-binding protein [Tsukamurella asaccharolytica]